MIAQGKILREYFEGDRINPLAPGLPVSPIDGYEYRLGQLSLGYAVVDGVNRQVTIAVRSSNQ